MAIENNNPTEPEYFAQCRWVLKDLRFAIARKLGIEEGNLKVDDLLLSSLGSQMARQLEDDMTSRGWDSIDTLLDCLEAEWKPQVNRQNRKVKK